MVSLKRTPLLWLLLPLLAVQPAQAQGPVLHEYFPPNPQEDVALNTTAMGSDLPAALETSSGVVQAPDLARLPSQTEKAYGGSSTPDSVDATYRVDSDTSRPDVVHYDDPFTPHVTPFKRLYGYDGVSNTAELVVVNKDLTSILVGGMADSTDDQFYGDMTVDLEKDVPVRIPTPGPGSKVLKAHTQPPVEFKLLRDSADNWFVRGAKRARVRLVMQLAVKRDVFGSSYPNVSWSALKGKLTQLPASVRPSAREVIAELGLQGMSPRSAVATMVQHFRSFSASTERPASSGLALYKELALSKKGVCRHRAYAFVITAIELGLPARMVRNEAHAWVEVWDGAIWHRVDLGGAAGRMEMDEQNERPAHVPPNDPFKWPEGSESGTEMANQAQTTGGQPGSGSSTASSDPDGAKPTTPDEPVQMLDLDGGAPDEDDARPDVELSVNVAASSVKRGHQLTVTGVIEAEGQACRSVRVDIGLKSETGDVYLVQSISTDQEGRFSDPVTIPYHLGVGEYEVVISTPGNQECGAGVLQ